MKDKKRMERQRKDRHPVVTGSRVRNAWEDPDDVDSQWYDMEESDSEDKDSSRKTSTQLLTVIQIIACTAILIGAIALRLNGGSLYHHYRNWYFESLNNSIVADSQMDHIQHVVIDLWSTISSSREESSSQMPQTSSATQDNDMGSAAASQPRESAAGSTSSAEQSQTTSHSASSNQVQNNASNASAVGNTPSSQVSS